MAGIGLVNALIRRAIAAIAAASWASSLVVGRITDGTNPEITSGDQIVFLPDVGWIRDSAGRIRASDAAAGYGAVVMEALRLRNVGAASETAITFAGGTVRVVVGIRAVGFATTTLGTAASPVLASGDGNVNGGMFFTLDGGDVIPHMAGEGVDAQRWESNVSTFLVPPVAPSFTVATLPAVAPAAQMIFVTDETGGAVLAFSDGTNFLRVTDRAIVA